MSNGESDGPHFLSRLATFVFVGAILETLGMLFYMQWANPGALETLMSRGISLNELVAFLLASPDRILVAGVLAAVAGVFAWIHDTSGSGAHAGLP